MNGPTDFRDPHAQGEAAAALLRSTRVVRERCGQLLARTRRGASAWFEVDDDGLDAAAELVARVTRQRHPGLRVPLHSRWRHFEAGGIDRRSRLDALLAGRPASSRIHTLIDLTVVSVLLDTGSGPDWRYHEASTGQVFGQAEGRAVASWHAFTAGLFSSDRDHPLRADALGLRALVPEHLAQAFQVSPANPLPGLAERAVLLRRLGEVMGEKPEVFGELGRPGGLFDMIVSPLGPEAPPHTADVDAHDLLSQLLISLSDLWPAGPRIAGVPVGDCWRHAGVRGEGATDGWVPFHKTAQWLTYSLLEPFEWCGVQVRGIDRLTPLAGGRNGGLLLDTGALRLRQPHAAVRTWALGDEVIVEWRALTVALLDELAGRVSARLGRDPARLPLGRVLEGGTWQAGRELARRLRGGLPPLRVASDGTMC